MAPTICNLGLLTYLLENDPLDCFHEASLISLHFLYFVVSRRPPERYAWLATPHSPFSSPPRFPLVLWSSPLLAIASLPGGYRQTYVAWSEGASPRSVILVLVLINAPSLPLCSGSAPARARCLGRCSLAFTGRCGMCSSKGARCPHRLG
jgi:hypothetical protein